MLGYMSYFFYISVSNLAKHLLYFGDLLFFDLIKSWVLFHVIYIYIYISKASFYKNLLMI